MQCAENPLLSAVLKRGPPISQKSICMIFKVSDPSLHEWVLLASQSRQAEWTAGGHNIFDPTTVSRGERSQEIDSVLKQTVHLVSRRVISWFFHLLLCYDTCEQSKHKCHSQLVREV